VLKVRSNRSGGHLSTCPRRTRSSDYTFQTMNTLDTASSALFDSAGRMHLVSQKRSTPSLMSCRSHFPDDLEYKVIWEPTDFDFALESTRSNSR